MKPEYDQWAEALIQEIYYAPEDQRVSIVKEHVLKAVKRGYLEGSNNAWGNAQDIQLQTETKYKWI